MLKPLCCIFLIHFSVFENEWKVALLCSWWTLVKQALLLCVALVKVSLSQQLLYWVSWGGQSARRMLVAACILLLSKLHCSTYSRSLWFVSDGKSVLLLSTICQILFISLLYCGLTWWEIVNSWNHCWRQNGPLLLDVPWQSLNTLPLCHCYWGGFSTTGFGIEQIL